jgi:hypothetical protein
MMERCDDFLVGHAFNGVELEQKMMVSGEMVWETLHWVNPQSP